MSIRYMFRLIEDQDQDLVDWLNSLRKGERSFFIRQALRKALREANPEETVSYKPDVKTAEPGNNPVSIAKAHEIMPNQDEAETKLDRLANLF